MMDEGGGHLNSFLRFFGASAMTLVITIASIFYFVAPVQVQTAKKPFDHSSTGYPLTGSHSSLVCASCHVPGTILSTPKLCFDCHNNQAIPGKPLNHMSSDQKCEACHQTPMWSDIRRVDHADIPNTTPCATCHTGVVAMGKPANHVSTTAPCQMCHSRTASFALATQFNHTGITSGCATCHDGVTATGKPANHIPTIAPCEMCHSSTVSFAIGVKFDHTGITTGCATCHNNVQALGKPSSHVPTSLPCETCHSSTVTFSIATYVHSPSDTNCSSCHDGITAMGLTTPPHIPAVA